MEKNELKLDLAIASLDFLSLREKMLLKKNIDSFEKLAIVSIEEICSIIGRVSKTAMWNPDLVSAKADRALRLMESKEIGAFVYGCKGYPAMLGTIPDAPYMFFYRGNPRVLEKPCVSVVGTRNVCSECAVASMDFSRSAASAGNVVVSGLANGIDSFAHKGALEGCPEASTVAVLPCGVDAAVPVSNRRMAQDIILSGGCICGEYVPGTSAEPWRYVQRNRLIAALSPCTVVMQAPPGSGALITAQYAVEYNRDVMFHSSSFCEEALKKSASCRKKDSKNRPENYLLDGAPVIENFDDFVAARNDPPGTHIYKGQLELF